MALIRCEECGKEISSAAELCPHCGCKTTYGKKNSSEKGALIVRCVGFVVLIIGIILAITAIFNLITLSQEWYYRGIGDVIGDNPGLALRWFLGMLMVCISTVLLKARPGSTTQYTPANMITSYDIQQRTREVYTKKPCPNCGVEVSKSYKACPYCGHELLPQIQKNTEPTMPADGSTICENLEYALRFTTVEGIKDQLYTISRKKEFSEYQAELLDVVNHTSPSELRNVVAALLKRYSEQATP